MLGGNDYKRGWIDGRDDALVGRDKDYRRMGLSLGFLFHGHQVLDTYAEGYNVGYAEGMREVYVVHQVQVETNVTTNNNNNQANTTAMSQTAQDFVKELQALKDLHEFLVSFCNHDIMDKINLYHGSIQGLIDSGLPKQQYEYYINNNYPENKDRYKRLLDHIVGIDLPRIRMYMQHIEDQIQAATGTSLGSFNLSQPDTSERPKLHRNIHSYTGGLADLEVQADAICDFGVFLKETIEELRQSLGSYESYCDGLLGVGVPRQMYQDYMQNCAQEDVHLIYQIVENIEHVDLPYLNKVLQQITASIGTLGGSYGRSI